MALTESAQPDCTGYPDQCPACGGNSAVTLIPAAWLPERQEVRRCAGCGSAFFSNRRIEPDYWQAAGQEEAYAEPAVEQALMELHRQALADLRRLHPQARSLLDAGCGEGLFLGLARQEGLEATGLEASPRGAELARERSGCPVRVSAVEDFSASGESWDLITLWDVIEHLPEPRPSLESLASALNPGGILALRTPNEASAFRALARGVARLSLGLGKGLLKYVYYHPHYVTFTPAGLEKLCARAGLRLVEQRLESTPAAFAREKIRHAYRRYPGHRLVLAALPGLHLIGRLGGRNKVVAYARKT